MTVVYYHMFICIFLLEHRLCHLIPNIAQWLERLSVQKVAEFATEKSSKLEYQANIILPIVLTTKYSIALKFHFSLTTCSFTLFLGYTLNTYLKPGFRLETTTDVRVKSCLLGSYFAPKHCRLHTLFSQE